MLSKTGVERGSELVLFAIYQDSAVTTTGP